MGFCLGREHNDGKLRSEISISQFSRMFIEIFHITTKKNPSRNFAVSSGWTTYDTRFLLF